MSDEDDDLSFGTSEESREHSRSRSPSISRLRSPSPNRDDQAGRSPNKGPSSSPEPRPGDSDAHGSKRDSHEKLSPSVRASPSSPRGRNRNSSASPPHGGGASRLASLERSPRDKSSGHRRRDTQGRQYSDESGPNRSSVEPQRRGHRPRQRCSAGRSDHVDWQEKSGRDPGHSSHAPLMSNLGTNGMHGHQPRNARRPRDWDSRREEHARSAPMYPDDAEPSRYSGRVPRVHNSEERGGPGRARKDHDGRPRDGVPPQPRGGMAYRSGSASRVEPPRRPPPGSERYQQDRNMPKLREAHDSFLTSTDQDRHMQQRAPKRSRDREAHDEGSGRLAAHPRSMHSGPPSQPPPPPPPRQAPLPPPPPPISGRNSNTQAPGSSSAADVSSGKRNGADAQGGGARRRRTGWEPARPAPANTAEALRSAPMPETREGGNVQVMPHRDLPGPPNGAPVPRAAPPPGQPAEKNFALSGVLAAETKRNEGGHVQKYSEPADAAVPRPGWRLYIYKGDQSSGKDCSCGPPIRLYRGSQTFWTFGKDKRVCHILAMHPSTSREHVAVQFRRTVKGEITPYVIDLDSSNGTYLRNQQEHVVDGIHGGGYDKLDAGRYYRIYSGDVIRLGESQRDYVFIVDDDTQN